MRPLKAWERQFLAVFLGTLPAIFLGFYFGMFASSTGSPEALASILARAALCAAPVVFLALLAPRSWFLPAMIYSYGFHCGYGFLNGLGGALSTLLSSPVAAITGHHFGAATAATRPELPWIFAIAVWLTALASFLRCQHSPPK